MQILKSATRSRIGTAYVFGVALVSTDIHQPGLINLMIRPSKWWSPISFKSLQA